MKLLSVQFVLLEVKTASSNHHTKSKRGGLAGWTVSGGGGKMVKA